MLRDGHEVALPRKEFALLDLLYSSPGKLFSREEIYAKIWGTEVVVGDRTIDVHIRKLRQKIRQKKIAMGHKPDDHEEEQNMGGMTMGGM